MVALFELTKHNPEAALVAVAPPLVVAAAIVMEAATEVAAAATVVAAAATTEVAGRFKLGLFALKQK
jgi:hypothetical protein